MSTPPYFSSSPLSHSNTSYTLRGEAQSRWRLTATHTTQPSCHSSPRSIPLRSPQMSNKAKFSLLEGHVKFVPKRASVQNQLDSVCRKTLLLYVFFFAPTFPYGCYFTVSRISIGRAICEGGAQHGETCETILRMPFSLNDWKISHF